MRRKTLIIHLVLGLLLLFAAQHALARDVLQQERCLIQAGEEVEGTLFVLCRELRIDGVVQGDVVGLAVETHIQGEVQGSIYLISGTLHINGQIEDDVHYGGFVMHVGNAEEIMGVPNAPNTIEGSIKSAAFSVTVHEQGQIHEGILALGYQLEILGSTEDEINFWGSVLQISGAVDGDVYATVGDQEADNRQIETLLLPLNLGVDVYNPGLFVAESANIRGALIYSAPLEGHIEGIVGGDVVYEPILPTSLQNLDEPQATDIYFNQSMREFGTLLVIGAITLFAIPQWVRQPLRTMRYRFFTSLSVGLLAFIISFPIVLIVLLLIISLLLIAQLFGLTNLGVALALVLGVVDIGSVGLFYFVAIYVGRALVGLALGRLVFFIILRNQQATRWYDYASLLVGVLLLSLAMALPGIGWVVNAAALFLGLGSIIVLLLDQFRRIRDSEVSVPPGWMVPSPLGNVPHAMRRERDLLPALPSDDRHPNIPLAPPPPPDPDNPGSQPAPGMRNLPEGFDFGFFEESPE